ncbi:MAG TPA: hypothetical protein VKD45_14650 [Hyphomicrobiaceae bacterium]|nr:hypothetical protein [Hyphomicrobiaceae bacterium]
MYRVATAPSDGHRRAARVRGWAVLAFVLLAGQPAILAPSLAHAQTSQPTISLPPAISAEAATQAALPIRVTPLDSVPRNSFVRVRGLPPTAALTEGYSIAPGSWAVSLAALPELKIMLPAGTTGRSEIIVTLVSIDGSVLAESRATLAIAAAGQRNERLTRDAGAPTSASILRAGVGEGTERNVQPPQPGIQMAPQDRERALRLVKKGDEQLAEGNISAARLFYERAADAGLAQGAMALAGTFDATELAQLGVRGIPPDPKQARRWYERAQQLGASDAEERLRRIGTK